MAIQSREFLGKKMYWEDGLVDYTESGNFSNTINQEINRINKEVTPEHRSKYISNLKTLVDANTKYWKDQLNKTKSEAQQQIDLLKQEVSKIRNKDRKLTADEVSILTYHANMLRSKAALIISKQEFKEFMDEISNSTRPVRQAFLDNAPSILKPFSENTAGQEQAPINTPWGEEMDYRSTSNNSYDPLKIRLDIGEIKNIIESVNKSLMSDADIQAESELNSKMKEFEQQKATTIAKEIAIDHTISSLNSKVGWEQIVNKAEEDFNG